jgi:aryl-alcohol dehydrogenase-like predicted oxidoreductase
MWAWQFATMQHVARCERWTPFVSMQDQYSLLQREEEREMLPLLDHLGVGSIPWSPLARGRLARPWGSNTVRSENDAFARNLYRDADESIVGAVQAVAAEHGVPMAQVGLAWVLGKPVVAAPLVGATKVGHLDDAVAALDVELSVSDVARLEAAYTPREPTGF